MICNRCEGPDWCRMMRRCDKTNAPVEQSKAPPWCTYPIALAMLPIAIWIASEVVEHFTP